MSPSCCTWDKCEETPPTPLSLDGDYPGGNTALKLY
jgi:hypothetical protein